MMLSYGLKTYNLKLSPVEALLFRRSCSLRDETEQERIRDLAGAILRICEENDFVFTEDDYPTIWSQASESEQKRMLELMKAGKALEQIAAFDGKSTEEYTTQLIRDSFREQLPCEELIAILKVICLAAAAEAKTEEAVRDILVKYGLETAAANSDLIKVPSSMLPQLYFSMNSPDALYFLGLDSDGNPEIYDIYTHNQDL